ncbi:D-alanyl-D-alanine carboxypeptidase/D-alanyl-D-alanine endopeptidase [Tsukamurella soli]
MVRVLIAIVVLALIVAGGIAGTVVYQAKQRADRLRAEVPVQPAAVAYTPQLVGVDPAVSAPTADGTRAAIAAALRNPDLGRFTGIITDAVTGDVLWQQDPDLPRTPASTTKLLTAAAALLTLGDGSKVTTTVVAGDEPGTVVVVGAGDPTLTSLPPGKEGLSRGAARISTLADQLRASGTSVQRILVDTSLFTGPQMAQGWDRADIAGGDITPMQAFTTDSGRLDPTVDESPRSPEPALTAGRALAADLGLPASAVADGTAPAGAKVLASVQSAALGQRLLESMTLSDNVVIEQIGMQVAGAVGKPRSIAGSAEAVLSVLQDNGFDVSGVTLRDANGLSTEDRIPAAVLDRIVTAATSADHPKLRPLLDFLPIAGATGTLSDRYTTADRGGAGYVRAKTGSLSGVNTLAGFVNDRDGRVLTFALMSSGTSDGVARPAIDAIATALRGCGCR